MLKSYFQVSVSIKIDSRIFSSDHINRCKKVCTYNLSLSSLPIRSLSESLHSHLISDPNVEKERKGFFRFWQQQYNTICEYLFNIILLRQ